MNSRSFACGGAVLVLALLTVASPAAATDTSGAQAPSSLKRDPVWLRRPSGQDIALYYPNRAANHSRSGAAEIHCKVTAAGTLTHCIVLDESPKALGFGDATLRLAHLFKMGLAPGDTRSLEGGTVNIPIRFTVGGGTPPEVSVNDGNRMMLVTAPAAGAPAASLFDCPSTADPHRRCQSHLVGPAVPFDPISAAAILAKAGLGEGGSVLECRVKVDGALEGCKLGGAGGPAAEAAAVEWAGHLRIGAAAKDGTPTANAHVLLEINWSAVRQIQAQMH